MSGDIYECDKCGGSISTSCDCAWGSDLLLCLANEEIKTLEEVVADIAKTDLADSVDHLWLSKWRNETKEKARQALEKLKEIRKKK